MSEAFGTPGAHAGNATPEASRATAGDGIELTPGLETLAVGVAGDVALALALALALAEGIVDAAVPWLGSVDEEADGIADGVDVHATSAISAGTQIAADFRTGQPPELREQ